MYKLFTLISFSIITTLSSAQIKSVNYLDYGTTDSLIRTKHPNLQLSPNYYVFLYPLVGATTTFAPQFIKEYQALQKGIKKCDEDILLLLYNDSGIAPNKLKEYFSKVLLLDDNEITRIKYVIDNDLYHKINKSGELAKLLYIYQSKLSYFGVCKTKTISSVNLNHSQYKIEKLNSIKLNTKDFLILEVDNIYPNQNNLNELFLMTDIEDEILKINISTGDVDTYINHKNLNTLDLYCRYIANNELEKCNYAKIWHKRALTSNRQTLNFSNIFQTDSSLFVFATLEVFEKNTETYKIKNDENKIVKVNSNLPILYAYSICMEYRNDSIEKIYKIPEAMHYEKKKETYNYFDMVCASIDNKIYTHEFTFPVKTSNSKFISQFKFEKDALTMEKKHEISLSNKTKRNMIFNNLKSFIFEMENEIYFAHDIAGDIYNIKHKKPVSFLFGNGEKPYKKEKFRQYAEHIILKKINFELHDMKVATINGEKHLITYYNYKGKPLIEIKDKNLNTIEVFDLTKIEDFHLYYSSKNRLNILINNNKIYFIKLQGNDYYLYQYLISKTCE